MKFYGQFNPQQDEYLYNNFFKGVTGGVSVEAGASNGVLENNTKFFEDELGWKTINVEPLPNWYNQLVKNRPSSINLNYALHPHEIETDVSFYIPEIPQYSFINHLGSLNENNLKKYDKLIQEISVRTITFNEIIRRHKLEKIDLFILDIEGFETEFLKSFNSWCIFPTVFCVEVSHCDENKINEILSKKYNFHSKHFANNIYTLKSYLAG